MTERTAEKVKNAECIIFSGGHFPTSEDPVKFKEIITPVLKKILQLDPERRSQAAGLASRTNVTEMRSTSQGQRPSTGRRIIEF